jgi:nucleotide-binding universal stress UspA family protein
MFNRILVPLDGSRTAEEALPLAEPLFHVESPRIDLLRVIPLEIREGVPIHRGEILQRRDEAREYLDRVAVRLRDRGADVEGAVRLGMPADEILKFAAFTEVDLIVMTTHGRSGVRRWIMGSVAERVMRITEVPMLVRKSFEEAPTQPPGPFKKILLPLDGHREAEQVLPYAEALARAYGSEVLVATILRPDESVAAMMGPPVTEQYLQDLCGRFRERRLTAAAVLRHGEPSVELRDLIEREKPDLVAMTTHGRTGLSRWVHGSVAETVLRSVTTPLFVLRIHPAEVEAKKEEGP